MLANHRMKVLAVLVLNTCTLLADEKPIPGERQNGGDPVYLALVTGKDILTEFFEDKVSLGQGDLSIPEIIPSELAANGFESSEKFNAWFTENSKELYENVKALNFVAFESTAEKPNPSRCLETSSTMAPNVEYSAQLCQSLIENEVQAVLFVFNEAIHHTGRKNRSLPVEVEDRFSAFWVQIAELSWSEDFRDLANLNAYDHLTQKCKKSVEQGLQFRKAVNDSDLSLFKSLLDSGFSLDTPLLNERCRPTSTFPADALLSQVRSLSVSDFNFTKSQHWNLFEMVRIVRAKVEGRATEEMLQLLAGSQRKHGVPNQTETYLGESIKTALRPGLSSEKKEQYFRRIDEVVKEVSKGGVDMSLDAQNANILYAVLYSRDQLFADGTLEKEMLDLPFALKHRCWTQSGRDLRALTLQEKVDILSQNQYPIEDAKLWQDFIAESWSHARTDQLTIYTLQKQKVIDLQFALSKGVQFPVDIFNQLMNSFAERTRDRTLCIPSGEDYCAYTQQSGSLLNGDHTEHFESLKLFFKVLGRDYLNNHLAQHRGEARDFWLSRVFISKELYGYAKFRLEKWQSNIEFNKLILKMDLYKDHGYLEIKRRHRSLSALIDYLKDEVGIVPPAFSMSFSLSGYPPDRSRSRWGMDQHLFQGPSIRDKEESGRMNFDKTLFINKGRYLETDGFGTKHLPMSYPGGLSY